MTIRRLRLIAFLGFLLLIVCSVAVTFAALQTQHADALVINLAGRQRMLIQKMTLEVLGVQIGANLAYRETLHETAHAYFERTLNALMYGGQAPYGQVSDLPPQTTVVTLPPTRDPEILAQLETVRATWVEFHTALMGVLENDPAGPAFAESVAAVERLSPMMVSQMDQAVRLYEAEASRKVALAQALQIGFLGVAVALLFTVLFLTERWLLLPIDQLGGAAQRIGEGDLDTPLSIAGLGEIKQLAGSFDDMRQNLAASRGEQARLYLSAHERLERISALHDIDVAITSSLGLNERLNTLLEKVTERLRVDAAAVALIKRDTQELVYVARRGLDGEFFADGLLKVKEGVAGQVAHSGEVAAIPDVSAEPRFVRRSIAARLGIVSYLAVPLQARGAIIGVLELATRERHEFLSEEIDFFVTLAGQASIAIENARLFDETQRRAVQQGALAETAGAILATLAQVEALWPAVTAAVQETLAADRSAVYLYDPAADRVTCPHASDLSDEYVAEINLRFHEVPGGRLLADPRPVIIADAQTDPAAAPIHDLATREGFHSYAVFPLTAPEGPLGALVAYRDLVAPFSPNDITTGQMLAHIVAVAMQNARLFDAERIAREQSELLREAAQAVSSTLNLDEVVRRILAQLKRVLTYDTASVLLLSETGKPTLVTGAGYIDERSTSRAASDLLATSPILAQMSRDLKPVIIADVRDHPGWIWVPGAEHTRSFLAVPIVIRERMIGALMVDNTQLDFFDETHARLAGTLAQHISVAIENARLFEATRRQVEELTALNEVAGAAAGAVSEDMLIERATQIIGQSLFPDDFGVLLVDEAARALRFHPSYRGKWDEEASKGAIIPLGQGVTGRVAVIGQPWRVPDVTREPAYRKVGLAVTMRSELCVPLKVGERVIGVINAESAHAEAFSEADERLLTTLAGQLATGIERARLFESLVNEQHHTALLYHLSMELAVSLNPQEVANRALQAATNALGVSRGNILMVENDSENMQLLAMTGYDHETINAINQRLNWTTSQGVSGRVVQTRTALIVPDISLDGNWMPVSGLDDWVNSTMSIPLITGGMVVGVLNLVSEKLDFFKPESLPLITAIASPVALALQNARLYESLRQRFKELEILADTSSALRKAGSYNDIPPILLAKAVEGLIANAGVLLLLENDELKFTALHGETSVSTGDTCPPDAGMMWQALESNELLFIPDVLQIEELHKSAICQALMGDALSCACVPLRTTTSAIGVVFLKWKKKSFLSADESRLLESLAEIAANAIHRSTLHLQTVQQAQDLTLAYGATIEGWSRALDLRDKETEGHSQRVTNLTLQLAQALGVSKSELEHIRRGALLHDIGKMGIPDNILRKAGALSDEEWTMMRRHPQLAHDMLFPIAYLQPALDIPYCHHEKWDGTGYPRGLKGEEIPLTARIFAVADVFDALTSDRPYRPAWTKRKTAAYIRQQTGIHFDPKVVDLFLKMIRRK